MCKAQDRYLYAIRVLQDRYLCVRSVDVAHYLGLTPASVSVSVRKMRDDGLIEVEPDGNLQFTPTGKSRVGFLSERVSFFRKLLSDCGVEPGQAHRDAISFSWEMSEPSYMAFKALYGSTVNA